jgi:hypothetical protein
MGRVHRALRLSRAIRGSRRLRRFARRGRDRAGIAHRRGARAAEGLRHVPWANLAVIFSVVMVVALGTTYLPARRASRVYPAEALRYE